MDKRYRILFDVRDAKPGLRKDNLKIKVLDHRKMIYEETLTIGQDFDIVLIRALDKILRKNKIDRLSLKSVETSGKIELGALSGMILRTTAQALKM